MKGHSDVQEAKHGRGIKRMTKNDLFDLRDRCDKLKG